MKKKTIGITLGVILGAGLIIGGAVLGYNKDTKVAPEEERTGYIGKAENYREIGAVELKEDQIFNNIKYTKNHLSTTDPEHYATFTSVVYNETGENISHKQIKLDFYDINGQLVGTMDSEIEALKPNESTMIFGIAELDFTEAYSFNVREA